jgi:transposase InsO family protein
MINNVILNRYVYTPPCVREAVTYLRNGRLPSRLRSAKSKARFRRRWAGFSVVPQDDDERDNDDDDDNDDDNNDDPSDDHDDDDSYHLFYRHRRVVPTDEVAALVSAQYNDAQTTGGRDRTYARLCKQYIGISRRAVMDALRNQEVWQLLRQPHRPRAKHVVRQPILAKRPWSRVQIDLIDMSRWANWNHGKHWALTAVDVFTKQAFAVPLRDKTAARVAKALEDHVLDEHDEVPTIVQSDNGGEFRNHEFAELAARRGFRQVFSASYSPQSNGCVERFNHTLKQLIRHHFVTSGTKRWIDVLSAILENYNSAVHSSTKFAPDELVAAWKEQDDSVLAKARATLFKRARKSLGSEPGSVIKVGDHVRTLVSRRKKPMKTGDTKLRRPVWSESIHAVENVSNPTNGLSLPRYTLEGSTERFYASDLQRVELDTLVPRRRRPSSGHARGFYKRVVIPVPALMERKAGARTTRRPVRFQDGASSSSSSSSSEDDEDGSETSAVRGRSAE